VARLYRAADAACDSQHPEVDIASLAGFSWERFFVFGPYTPVERIEQQLGFSWPQASQTGIEVGDTFSLLVFEHEQRVVSHFKCPRTVDFEGLGLKYRFSYGQAVFGVHRRTNSLGRAYLILRPLPTAIETP
jgi:hypothetical protein